MDVYYVRSVGTLKLITFPYWRRAKAEKSPSSVLCKVFTMGCYIPAQADTSVNKNLRKSK